MTESATDDYLRLLAHRHRRTVLNALIGRPSTGATLDECFDSHPNPPGAYEEYEHHLELLEGADVIEYDVATRTILQGQRFDQIAPLARAVSDASRPHDFKRERDQLALVNRTLGHDLRNALDTVRERVRRIAESEASDGGRADRAVVEERIEEMTSRLETMESFTNSVVDPDGHALGDYNLRDVLHEQTSKLQRRNGDLNLMQNEIPDVSVRADDRLPVVFENILENAVEHNDSESPTVQVTGRCTGDVVETTVADDGPGIPDKTKKRVAVDGDLRADGDSGLGLRFVKRTVDSYRGDLAIKDQKPRGTAVQVRLRRSGADVGSDEMPHK